MKLKYSSCCGLDGHKKAIIAIARKMHVAIYHMIRDGADFHPVDHEAIAQNTRKTKGLNLNNVTAFLQEQGADESTIRLVEAQCSDQGGEQQIPAAIQLLRKRKIILRLAEKLQSCYN